MEKKFLKYSEKIIEYGFYALVFLVPLVFTTSTYELFEFPKMILVYLLTILIVAAFLVKSIFLGELKLPRTPLDKPIAFFVLANLLSTIFSIDRYTSIFGYYTRFNGGLLSLICYIALYYIFIWEIGGIEEIGERREIRGRFVKLLLLSSVLVSVYGILQHFGIDKDYWVQDVQRRVFSTLGQPNWLAAFLVMILPVSLSLLIKERQHRMPRLHTIAYLLTPSALYSAFWFTYSRSGLLGFAAAMGTFLVFLGRENLKKNWRPLALVGLVWVAISVLTFAPTIAEKIPVAKAAQGAAATPSAAAAPPPSGSTVDIRLAVWKGTLELIKDHPLLGTGPETFAYSFLLYRPVELNQTAEWEFLYNKAHNEYLNIASCTGLLGLGAYLFLIASFIRFSLISKPINADNSILRAGLFAGWVGVLVTNFFGFGVVVTSLLFWLFMALNVSMCQCVNVSEKKTNSLQLRWFQKTLLAVFLFLILYSSFFILNLFRADVAFNNGEKFSRYGLFETAAGYYRRAIAFNFREPRYHRELAYVLTKQGIVEEAEREAEIAYNLNPKNSLTIRSLISTYVDLADLDSKYLTRAENLISELTNQQPTNPQLYYQQALILLKSEKNEEAVAALQKALELKGDYKKVRDLLEEITDQRDPLDISGDQRF